MSESLEEPSVKDGLLWSDGWVFAYEGPFTRLTKLAVVNQMSSRAINRALFGCDNAQWSSGRVHGRSLLDTHWMALRTRPRVSPPSAGSIQASSLYAHCGRLCKAIASDARFRYCPTCLEHGFQSSLFQIDGLTVCPIHSDKLTDKCPTCDAPCPRYAIEKGAFKEPMRCSFCGAFYSGAWTMDGIVTAWSRVKRCDHLDVVEYWLQQVASQAVPSVGDYALSDLSERDQRLTIFDILRRAAPLNLPSLRQLEALVSVAKPRLRPQPLHVQRRLSSERVIIYKAIRRHFTRALRIRKLMQAEMATPDLAMSFCGPLYSRRGKTPPVLHGFLLWRARFERSFSLPERRRCAERLILETKQQRWLDDEDVLDAAIWASFILYCLKQDLRIAAHWADQMVQGTALTVDGGPASKFELLLEFGEDLSPSEGAWPRGVGIVRQSDQIKLFCVSSEDQLVPDVAEL
jgi:hypothetical protein